MESEPEFKVCLTMDVEPEGPIMLVRINIRWPNSAAPEYVYATSPHGELLSIRRQHVADSAGIETLQITIRERVQEPDRQPVINITQIRAGTTEGEWGDRSTMEDDSEA